MVLRLQSKKSIRFNVWTDQKKRAVVWSDCMVSVWEIGPPCTWSDTRPKHNMRTFFKELILPRILVSNTYQHIECQYLHTISLWSKKNAALILGYLRKDVSKGWIMVTVAIQCPQFLRADRKNTSGQTIGTSKIWSQCQSQNFFFFFSLWGHNFGLDAQSLKWIAWRERLWCDNHSQVNLSSVTSAQGIQCAISRKTKTRYKKKCFLNNVLTLIRWLICAHLKARL